MLCLLLLSAAQSFALGPHEIALLVNQNSPESGELAADYAHLRRIPSANIIPLSLPEGMGTTDRELTPDEFDTHIWTPATNRIQRAGLTEQILAWVYSVDFPLSVSTEDFTMSIHGMTYMRNSLPEVLEVQRGIHRSQVFAGPYFDAKPMYQSQSFDVLAAWLGSDMPMPAMSLGVTGLHGNTMEEISRYLAKGLQSDSTAPSGTVYIVTSEDMRSRARAWQVEPAVREIRARGLAVVVTNALPTGRSDIIGLVMGAATVSGIGRNAYPAGCVADNLTSYGAKFDTGAQTKITAWLREGVTASAGTVAEPKALWMKFPTVWFFAHYAAGCTVIESYYQSISSPLQILMVGDPLAQPWAPRAEMRIEISGQPDADGSWRVRAKVDSGSGAGYGRFMFLIDGRARTGIERKDLFTVSPDGLSDGSHTLRAVAYRNGSVRTQAFAEMSFTVNDGKIELRSRDSQNEDKGPANHAN